MPKAANSGGVGYADDDAHLDLKPLLRLGAWGAGACAALAVAVLAAKSDLGGRRAGTAIASLTGTANDQAAQLEKSGMLARLETEREAKRLAEAVRTLSGDRDRLAGRVAQLERNLDDLTGSVARVAAAQPPTEPTKPAAAPPAVAAPQTVPAQAAPAKTPDAQPTTASTPPSGADRPIAVTPLEPPRAAPPSPLPTPPAMAAVTPLWREHAQLPAIPPKEPAPEPKIPQDQDAVPLPRPAPVAVLQSYAAAGVGSSVIGTRGVSADAAAPGSASPGTDYAVDLGAAPHLTGLRALWEKVRIRQPASLEGLRPLVNVRDGAKPGTTELRLIAGPLPDTTAVAARCAALTAVAIACQPAVFEGQRLPVAPRPRPAPAPAPPVGRPPV